MLRGPQTRDQLEWFLAGIFCLIETGKPITNFVPEDNIHRRLGKGVVDALVGVDALRPRFRKASKTSVWDAMAQMQGDGMDIAAMLRQRQVGPAMTIRGAR